MSIQNFNLEDGINLEETMELLGGFALLAVILLWATAVRGDNHY